MSIVPHVTLRVAAHTDIEAILSILAECASDINVVARYPDQVRRDLEDRFASIYVIEHSGTPIGVVVYRKKSDSLAHIDEIGIRADFRGRGIGTHVLGSALTRLKKHGYQTVELETNPKNEALNLYERLGFKTVGRIENFKESGQERLVLQRPL